LVKNLKNDGGQNPILAAQLGCKVYHGPYIFNFEDVYKFLNEKNISKQISSVNELTDNLINDFTTEKKDFLETQKFIELIGLEILKKTCLQINNFLKYEVL